MKLSPQQQAILDILKRRSPHWVSSWDIVMETHILNATARISELRRAGIGVDCRAVNRAKGHYEYREATATEQEVTS